MSEIALLGKKIGMTREFYKSGQLVPVTVLKVEKARVIQVIEEEKRGYKAVQLGYGKIKNSKLTKSMKGVFAKKNTEAKKKLKEFRVNDTSVYKEGNEFGLEIFKDIKFAICSETPSTSNNILPGFTLHAKYSGEPFPLPILTSIGFFETGIFGNILVHTLPCLFICLVKATLAASICFPVTLSGCKAFNA